MKTSSVKFMTYCIFSIFLLVAGCAHSTQSTNSIDNLNKLYKQSIVDSMVIEPEEIMPVAIITPDSDNVTWDRATNKYFLLTFHKQPNNYTEKTAVTLDKNPVWVFCDKEAIKWYSENSKGVTDWSLRMNQLLGLPPTSGYTHVSGFWVSPEDIIRPAYVTNITKSKMTDHFKEPVNPEYHKWFNNNIVRSYFEGAYPWTRIGYTYDWAPNANEKGLSEFQIQKGSTIWVEFTEPLGQFIHRLK